ncbi:FAD-dependent oxidoreductase [Nocardia yamanashiensis]|uniref:FAD-dependent oxidoreductase n=1 Tax=Nocardia yamanashiensis TaxID=209247 RepID=UPI00082B8209|nr:FAD-dependent oxidoreductase [Nocardia yamanashiensis]
MAYVITEPCCNDAACVPECPVDCIRPVPGTPEFAAAEQLYIDPAGCIDCGSCVPACPVNAIFAEEDLLAPQRRYTAINAAYFETHPLQADPAGLLPAAPRLPRGHRRLRVAIVGSGPAACYAARALLRHTDVEVDMFEKLPMPWGLVRSGVAPDHPDTKQITASFESAFGSEAFALHLNVTVGADLGLPELLAHHHAVICAVGASGDRRLGIPGESLPGSHSATEFVAWYNGHPAYADHWFDLSGDRAVIVGNGNVALDAARILVTDPERLAATDIADHALVALRHSKIREVVVLGRRTPVHAAYTGPEFLALGDLTGVDIVVAEHDLDLDPVSRAELDGAGPAARLKWDLTVEYARAERLPRQRRIDLRYLASPIALHGSRHVTGIEYARNEMAGAESRVRPTAHTELLDTSLVLRSIGYRGEPLAGLPFDPARGVIPNREGRVLDVTGAPLPGRYVTGWIKRGPHGVIGANRVDAEETVQHLLADFLAGRLPTPAGGRPELLELLSARCPDRIDRTGWRAIDAAERAAGAATGRPRVKITGRQAFLSAARAQPRAASPPAWATP